MLFNVLLVKIVLLIAQNVKINLIISTVLIYVHVQVIKQDKVVRLHAKLLIQWLNSVNVQINAQTNLQ